jgi:hypothetical protein
VGDDHRAGEGQPGGDGQVVAINRSEARVLNSASNQAQIWQPRFRRVQAFLKEAVDQLDGQVGGDVLQIEPADDPSGA